MRAAARAVRGGSRWLLIEMVMTPSRRPCRPPATPNAGAAGSGRRPGACPAAQGNRRPRSRGRGRDRRRPARPAADSPASAAARSPWPAGRCRRGLCRPGPPAGTGCTVYSEACAPAETKSRTARIWRARRLVRRALHGDRHTAGDVVVAAAVQVGQDARPHQQHDAAVAVVVPHDGAAHLDQRRPQRVELGRRRTPWRCRDPRGDGAWRRQHPVAADQLAGAVLADQQVVAELVEPVGIAAVEAAPASWKPGSEVNTS